MRTTYVFSNGELINKATGEPAPFDPHAPVCAPFIAGDIPEYASPIDGRPITSRSHRREDLKRNGCVEWEPGIGKAAQVSEKNRHRIAKRAA